MKLRGHVLTLSESNAPKYLPCNDMINYDWERFKTRYHT